MRLIMKPVPVVAALALLFTMSSLTGCPDDDDDDNEVEGGMCFYDCSSTEGSMSGCWQYDSEQDCLDEVEEVCDQNNFTINESEYVEGCAMCNECAPSWYEGG